jgi:hypothetical protein
MLALVPAVYASGVRLEANLVGPVIGDVTPEGEADFRATRDADRRRFEVEVDDINLPDGAVLLVTIDDLAVGTILLEEGEGELELDTEAGEMAPHPDVGSVVEVFSGEIRILSGVFVKDD